MKRSSKILLAAIAATGITFTAISWVSAQGGWGGNCYRNNPMQGQGYGQMNPQGYGPGMGGCPMQSAKGYGANGGQGAGCATKGRHGHGGGNKFGGMQGGPGANSATRLEALKTQLQITTEQEPAWNAFEQAIANKSAAMGNRSKQRGAMMSLSVEDRVKLMRERAGHMTVMADAISNLNTTLTEDQKALLSRMGGMGRLR
ncbi:MAG: Spy/CpxP family protein refolding chaperone [Candidatus Sedimenticola sp. (ex Thyasira tokunagai)]